LPEVGLWRSDTGALVGLVSLDVYRVRWESRTSIILFTSSVVIDDRFRGRDLVLRTGMKLLVREKLRRPWARAYWLFDTFSYKSYMILPRNLAEFLAAEQSRDASAGRELPRFSCAAPVRRGLVARYGVWFVAQERSDCVRTRHRSKRCNSATRTFGSSTT